MESLSQVNIIACHTFFEVMVTFRIKENFHMTNGSANDKSTFHNMVILRSSSMSCPFAKGCEECEESKVPFITFWVFILLSLLCKILIQVFIVLKPNIIFTFLIHCGSLQKILTAFLTLFGIHRKINGQFFLSAQARCFLVLKRF